MNRERDPAADAAAERGRRIARLVAEHRESPIALAGPLRPDRLDQRRARRARECRHRGRLALEDGRGLSVDRLPVVDASLTSSGRPGYALTPGSARAAPGSPFRPRSARTGRVPLTICGRRRHTPSCRPLAPGVGAACPITTPGAAFPPRRLAVGHPHGISSEHLPGVRRKAPRRRARPRNDQPDRCPRVRVRDVSHMRRRASKAGSRRRRRAVGDGRPLQPELGNRLRAWRKLDMRLWSEAAPRGYRCRTRRAAGVLSGCEPREALPPAAPSGRSAAASSFPPPGALGRDGAGAQVLEPLILLLS